MFYAGLETGIDSVFSDQIQALVSTPFDLLTWLDSILGSTRLNFPDST